MLKFLKLPTPKELGKETNCLPFSPLNDDNKYSWEDYDKEVKQLYPFRYFINETLPDIFNLIKEPFVCIYNYIKYNFVPKYRYHILDLRQLNDKDSCDYYRYGYSDVRQRMLYAVFNLLTEFVEKEVYPLQDKINYLERVIAKKDKDNDWEIDSNEHWLEVYIKIKNLYNWWKYTRKFKYNQSNKLCEIYMHSKNNLDIEKWIKSNEDFDKEEQEMFIKACNLREYFWE